MRAFWAKLRGLVLPGRTDRDVSDEIRHFLEESASENERAGMTPDEARRAARVELGSPAAVHELVRSSGWDAPIRAFGRDVRYGVRLLGRSPGFTAAALLLISLGIGATTALFSVADEVLFRPLPVRSPQELVVFGWTLRPPLPSISVPVGIVQDEKSGQSRSTGFSYLTFQRLQAESRSLAGVFAFSSSFPVADAESSDGVAIAQLVSGNYYELLGVTPRYGRLLIRDDDRPAAPPVAVISHRYWDRRFGRAADVIGKMVQVGTLSTVVVGVSPPGFTGTQDVGSAPDITIPLELARVLKGAGPKNINRMFAEPFIWSVRLMGRMRPGVAADDVRDELAGPFAASAIESYRSDTSAASGAPDLTVMSGSQGVSENRRNLGQFVLILALIVGLLLLIVCTNLAHLLYARGEARQAEVSVRLALGASRTALLRQLLTESALLSIAGGAIGVWLAWWGKDLLLIWLTRLTPSFVFEPRMDTRVLTFAMLASIATGLGVAVAPALRTTRARPQESLRQIGRSGSSRTVTGRLLLTAEIALSVVLVVLAGLLLRSSHNLASANLGVDAERLLWFNLRPALPPGVKDQRAAGPMNGPMFAGVLDRLAGLPGVQAIGYAQYPLVDGERAMPYVSIPGQPKRPDEDRSVYYESVSPEFFGTVGMPVVRGRGLTKDDAPGVVAVVNETLAHRFFGGHAIGQHIGVTKDALAPEPAAKDLIEIVGVVRDAKYMSVRESELPGVFVSGMLPGAGAYVIRTSGDPAGLAPAIKPALSEFSRFSVRDVRTQKEQTARTFVRERHFASVSTIFGALALALTGIGLYGLLSFSVVRRTREIGVRVALGASPTRILTSVVAEMITLTAIGSGAGVLAALGVARVTDALLFGLTPSDPTVMSTAVFSTFVIAAIAAVIPARRAASVDPLLALRAE